MAYALLTTNYGTSFANAPALLLDSVTGQPATILSSATGGLVNDQGKATLDSNGVLSVYVDTARTWTVTLTDKTPSYRNLITAEFEPGSTTPALRAGGVEVFSGSQVGGIRSVVSGDWISYRAPRGTVRPGLLVVGNSIAGQSSRNGQLYTTTITATAVRAGANAIQLVAGGVAALGLSVNDYVVVGLCNQQPWPVQVTGITGEQLTLKNRLPRMMRASAGVSKVAAPAFWGGIPRQLYGIHNAANALLGAPFDLLPGHGHGGATAAEILAALPGLLAHYRPAVCFLHLFENDIGGGKSAAELVAIADKAAGMCVAVGAVPIVVHCLPTTSVNAARAAVYDSLRDSILQIGDRIRGAYGCDPGAIYLDTTDPVTPRKPLAGWTDGVVHPVPSKIFTIGAQILPVLSALAPFGYPDWASMLDGANANMAGTSGAVSNMQAGSVSPNATTVTASAGVVATSEKTAGGKLRVFGSIPGASTTGDAVTINQASWSFPATWGPRDRVKVVADIEIDAGTNLFTFNVFGALGVVAPDCRMSATVGALDAAVIGNRITLESAPVPVSDVAATAADLSLTVRSLAVASPSGVAFDYTVHSMGWVVVPYGEMHDGALADI